MLLLGGRIWFPGKARSFLPFSLPSCFKRNLLLSLSNQNTSINENLLDSQTWQWHTLRHVLRRLTLVVVGRMHYRYSINYVVW